MQPGGGLLAWLVLAVLGHPALAGRRLAISHRGPPIEERRVACKRLCEKYAGGGSEQRECSVDCNVRTDLANTGDNSNKQLRRFANKQMDANEGAEAYGDTEDKACEPLVDVDNIDFEDVDLNGDGGIAKSELTAVGSLLCLPSDLIDKLYSDMDKDTNGLITVSEWNRAGEDTVYEYEVDKMVDNQMADQPTEEEKSERQALKELLAEVQAPDFEVLDHNGDGHLADWEILNGVMRAVMMRDPSMPLKQRRHMLEMFKEGLSDLMHVLDANGDGVVDPEEYAAAKQGKNLGDEIKELANGMEDQQEGTFLLETVQGVLGLPSNGSKARVQPS